jgi:large subunit ribosomal protein L2
MKPVIHKEFDITGRPNNYANMFAKQEVINQKPLTSMIWHRELESGSDYIKQIVSDEIDENGVPKMKDGWELHRTSPANPRQLWQCRAWKPVIGLRKSRGHTTGSLRAVLPDLTLLWQESARALTVRIRKSGGRDHTGRLRTRHRGGAKGKPYLYRVVDFKRRILDEPGIVERIEWDPFRSAHLAFIRYLESGKIQYQYAVNGQKPGDTVIATRSKLPPHFQAGYSMPLKFVPNGATVCCIETIPKKGMKFCRAAGTSAKLVNKGTARKGYALLKLSSGEMRLFDLECMATLGQVSNPFWKRINWGKAGNRRKLGTGWRPAVRGVAMNAVAHPHGGGTKHKRKRPPHGGGLVTNEGMPQTGFKTMPDRKLRRPVDMQMVLKRRPRNFKKGQLF